MLVSAVAFGLQLSSVPESIEACAARLVHYGGICQQTSLVEFLVLLVSERVDTHLWYNTIFHGILL